MSYYLSTLQSRLNCLENDKASKEKALDIQKKRLLAVHNIIAGLGGPDFNVTCISMDVHNICYELPLGFAWTESISGLPDQISVESESPYYMDSNLGEADSNLKAELTDIQNKIDELEEDIREIKSNISSTNRSISAEKSRIAAEARRRAEEARAAAAAEKAKEKKATPSGKGAF